MNMSQKIVTPGIYAKLFSYERNNNVFFTFETTDIPRQL